jgi:hypothetical protein
MKNSPLNFHHLGIATRNIDIEYNQWMRFGYRKETEVFKDINQGVKGIFLVGTGPRLELLEPLENSKTLDPYLKKGIGFYHYGYKTRDIFESLDSLVSDGFKLIRKPMPAIAFDGKEICFLINSSLKMIELIQE